jgi:uncharacterized glyoxalase superfamily protein PhnB
MKTEKDKNLTPAGYSTVSPYLMVESVEKEIEFLENVFDAEILEEIKHKDGQIMHGEVRIGNVVIMMGKSGKEYPAIQSMNYVHTNNVDEMYQTALKNKAVSLMIPTDQLYGFREAGFKDPQGNQWWIAQQIEELSSEEIQERLSKQKDTRSE